VNIVESSDILSGTADLSGVLAVDPQLGPLQDNGGPTMTMAIDKNSPAYNAGKNADADGLEYDQRGPELLRIVRGRVDLGAFEAVVDSIEFTDNFNRPNAPDLGPDYTQPSGQLAIRKETAVALGTEMGVALVNDLSSADVTMEADINVRREGSQAGLMTRYTPAVGAQLESYYLARLVRRKGMVYAEILRVVDGQAQRLGQRVALGDHQRNRTLRFELVGNELRLLINGKVKVSVTDDAIAGPGLVGLRARNKGIFDNLAVTG
jgi:hypothetical protein